jgi:hypothetical protein
MGSAESKTAYYRENGVMIYTLDITDSNSQWMIQPVRLPISGLWDCVAVMWDS